MGGGGGGRLFEAGRLLTFSAFRMGAYSRWALIRGWALIRINTVYGFFLFGRPETSAGFAISLNVENIKMKPPYRTFSLDKNCNRSLRTKKIKANKSTYLLLGYSYLCNNESRRINRESNAFFIHILQ